MTMPHRKTWIATLALFFCLRTVTTDDDSATLGYLPTLSSLESTLEILHSTSTVGVENATEYIHANSRGEELQEHAAAQKWKKAEKVLKKAVDSAYKKILPMVLRGAEDVDISPRCSRSLMKMMTGVKQMKLWAFQMLDSFGVVSSGILKGNINSLGDYDECLEVEVPGHFHGQYCSVDILAPMPERRPFVSTDAEIPEFINLTKPDTIISEFLRKAPHYYRVNFRTSTCVPSTCSREDIEKIAKKVAQMADVGFDVLVPNCESAHDEVQLGRSEIAIIVVISTLIFLGTIATAVDVILKLLSGEETYQDNLSVPVKYLLCFSFYTNTVKLLKPDNSPDSIKIFHGMKVITILWVILNHTYYYFNYQGCGFLVNAREVGKEIAFQLVANGFLNVETFFFISAVLISYGVMKMKEKKVNVTLYIFRRIWRLTPPFMLVIACVFLLPYLGSGPVWKETVAKQLTEKCRNYWWSNLIFINNFVPSSEMCLQWMWYIPVDTHLYFLSLIVILPLKSNPRLAFIMNMVMLLSGIVISAAFHVYYGLHPTAIYAFNHPEDVDYYVDRGYFRTYLHCSTYCVGLAVGYFIATRPKIRIPLPVNIIGWLTACALALSVLYGVYDWNQGNVPGLAMSAVYAGTNKFVWSSALGWVTIACMTGHGGIITRILSWQAFVPLGRLTYMAYLIHPLIHMVYTGSTRIPIRTEHRTILYLYLGNVLLAFMCAYGFSLLFESPFMAIEKVMFSRQPTRKPSNPTRSKIEESDEVEHSIKYKSNGLKENNGVYAIKIKQVEADC